MQPEKFLSSVGSLLSSARAANVAPDDYKGWLCAMLSDHFRGTDQFAPHMEEYWNHVWTMKPVLRPRPCIAPWFRRGMKSTSAEATPPVLAALGLRDFGLYVSGTQDKADGHLETIKDMLINSRLRDFYPKLAKPEVRMIDDRRVPGTWNHAELNTDGGLTIMACGLDKSVRGLKKGNQRPGFIILDDIEDEDDSLYAVLKKIGRIKAGILSAGASEVAVFFVQNLIHRDSVISQTLDGRADMMHGALICGGAPIPALRNDEYETRGSGNNRRHFILKGEPTWVGMSLEACQEELNLVGMHTWLLEYQHRVNTPKPGAIFPAFSEAHHLIRWSDFARVFSRYGAIDANGKPRIPQRGNCAQTFDQGTTDAHPTVSLWDWQPAEEMPFNGDLFFYREMCWPAFPIEEENTIVVPDHVGMDMQDAEREWHETIKWRQGSHEAKAVRNTFGFFLGQIPGYKNMIFTTIKTANKKQGIVEVQNLLAIDQNDFHPFRIDPRTLTGELRWCEVCKSQHDGEHLRGKPGIFFICEDSQATLTVGPDNILAVSPYLDSHGFARTRWEFPKYIRPRTIQGMESSREPKIDDDAMDALIAAVARRMRLPQEKTDEQREEDRMPEHLRKDTPLKVRQENPYFDMLRATALAAVRDQMKTESNKQSWRAGIRAKLRGQPR